MAKYRRTNFLINKRFQLRYILFVCSWILALSLVYPFLHYSLFMQFLEYMKVDPLGPEIEELDGKREAMMQTLILIEALFVVVVAAISVFMSHKIAGPIFKTVRTLRAYADTGELQAKLFFRKGDNFPELAEAVNYFSSRISDRAGQARAHIEKAMASANDQQRRDLEQALSSLKGL